MHKYIFLKSKVCLFLFLATICLSNAKWAYASCTVGTQNNFTSMVNGLTFSAGSETPIGATVYRQITYGKGDNTINCTNGQPILRYTLNGGTLYPGETNAYATGINGLAFKFFWNGNQLPYTRTISNGNVDFLNFTFEIKAVKLGPLQAGTSIPSMAPQLRIDVADNDNIWKQVAYTNFNSGSGFSVTLPTCTTPDINYVFDPVTPADFSAGKATTEWKDTPVILAGCGAFTGNSGDTSSLEEVQEGYSPNQAWTRGVRQKNKLSISLTPQTSIIDAEKGILGIATGSGSATGLGIQLGQKLSGTYLPFSFGSTVDISPALNSTANVTFPIGARLIRTSGALRPGAIQARVVYTINYQ